MANSLSDIELKRYQALLTSAQKKSLQQFLQLVTQSQKELSEVQEAETEYGTTDFNLSKILTNLSEEQKEALLGLLESFRIEEPGQRISIEQYNKEIEEAEAEIERGEFLSQEEVVKMSKEWIHGK